MVVAGALFVDLIDDAAMFPPGDAPVPAAVAAHLDYRRSWFAPMIGPLVVRDTDLDRLGRAALAAGVSEIQSLAVSVINGGGVDGLRELAGRRVDGVRVVAVESALRETDDLAGEARRTVAAVDRLGGGVTLFVEFPFAPGWEGAVEAVRAAGVIGVAGKLRTGGPHPADTPSCNRLAERLRMLIGAGLPFKATAGLHHAVRAAGADPDHPRTHGFLNVLTAVQALLDGCSEADTASLLGAGGGQWLARLSAWDTAEVGRVRRMFRSFGCCGVGDPVRDLVALGLVREPA